MMANRSDRRLLTLRCVRALEAVGMSTRTRRADFHQGQGSFATPISQAGYMTATRFPLSVPHPCTRAGSIYDTMKPVKESGLKRNVLVIHRRNFIATAAWLTTTPTATGATTAEVAALVRSGAPAAAEKLH